ncbi:MAG: SDR family oxidoreductase [Planctomycetaceae bacterium]|nr:SDR family oxidoreductase [Planctomycetaceae bacterium]
MGTAIPLENLRSVKMGFSLEGRKAVVTGAAGGIGYAVCVALAEMGADVALVDLRHDVAVRYAAYLGEKFHVQTMAVACDVGDEEQVDAMMETVTAHFGWVDAVHSNAGILVPGDSGDMPVADWRRIVDINYTSMFLVDRAAANHMHANGRGGAIVNTASMSAHIVNRHPDRHLVGYTSTKAAVLHLTKAMAMDYCRHNIRVNSVSPGYMYSGLHDRIPQERLDECAQNIPMGRFGTMNEIGAVVAFLLSENASYITGSDILVDGGFCAW